MLPPRESGNRDEGPENPSGGVAEALMAMLQEMWEERRREKEERKLEKEEREKRERLEKEEREKWERLEREERERKERLEKEERERKESLDKEDRDRQQEQHGRILEALLSKLVDGTTLPQSTPDQAQQVAAWQSQPQRTCETSSVSSNRGHIEEDEGDSNRDLSLPPIMQGVRPVTGEHTGPLTNHMAEAIRRQEARRPRRRGTGPVGQLSGEFSPNPPELTPQYGLRRPT